MNLKMIAIGAFCHGLVFMLLFTSRTCAEDMATVLCRIDESKITARREVPATRALKGRHSSTAALQPLQAQMLSLLVDRRLVLRYLRRTKQGASEQDIDYRIEQIGRHLARRRKTISQYLDETDQNSEDLRRRVAWEIGWQRFRDKHLTDQSLQRYFESHRRYFDGTRLRVAHILSQLEANHSEDSLAATAARATEIATRIAAQELTFSEAAQKYSDAPSATDGGDIGFILRREPMPDSFSRPVFSLEQGEMSPPIHTKFGVHLIQRTEIQPGDRTWQEVRPELSRALMRNLFQQVANRERPLASIEYTSGGRKIYDWRVN